MKYERKPLIVDAVQCTDPTEAEWTALVCNAGDWLLTGLGNQLMTTTNVDFQQDFMIATNQLADLTGILKTSTGTVNGLHHDK